MKVRVRYPETDRMGVAHHVNYLIWFELGRTELMREAGLTYREVEDRQGVMFPVIEIHAEYKASVGYDETIEIRSRVAEVSRVRLRFSYRIMNAAGGELLAEGYTVHASVGRDGRPRRMPTDLAASLRALTE